MTAEKLSVRQLELDDIGLIVDYFLQSDNAFLAGMGVDVARLPARDEWIALLTSNFYLSPDKKSFFYMIWQVNDEAVGHCNINKINFGQDAFMHH